MLTRVDASLAFYILFLIGFVAVVFLDWLEWSTRVSELGASRISTALSPLNLWFAAWLAFMIATLPGSPSEKTIEHGRSWIRLSLFVVFVGTLLASYLLARRKLGPAATLLARGALRQRVKLLAQAAGIRTTEQQTWGVDSFNVCVLPDGFRWWIASANRLGMTVVMVPLRFLDWFSRDEVDALVARQLAHRQWKYRLPGLIGALLYAAASFVVLLWLHPDPKPLWIVIILLLAIEISGLAISWQRLSRRADLRAVEISGNPEAHISALAELSRLSNRRMDRTLFQSIARKNCIEPDRLELLLKERPRPADDRYPTTGDYFTTGM